VAGIYSSTVMAIKQTSSGTQITEIKKSCYDGNNVYPSIIAA
jgi:hypothetical protein